jgi:hypothetical protein
MGLIIVMKKIVLPFILVFVTLIGTPNLHNAVAHTFSGDESASFLALVEMIKSALLPIKQDISSNVTLAREQAQYAKLLLNDSVLKELKERNQRSSCRGCKR